MGFDVGSVGVATLGLGRAGRGGGFFFSSSGFWDANGSNPKGSFCELDTKMDNEQII